MSSTLPVSDDPFEVLGVARDVTDKDLKKRYFALLRQYPPETNPEEFNRVQHAYEALKDPASRAELDKKEPYEDVAEPYRTRLREVLAQLQNDDVELARTALKTLIAENPDLDDARNLLQQVYFNEEKFAEAEEQIAELSRRHPEESWYYYRHALVLSRLERHADAHRVSQRWVEVCHGKDVRAWDFIAETLAAQNRHDEAYRQLELGLQKVDAKWPLLLTRMHLRLDKLDKKGAQADLAALEQQLRTSDDETRQQATERMQSLAAMYFSKQLPDEANLILKVARELGGKGEGVQFPPRLEVFIEELPESSQQWLVEETKQQHLKRIDRRGKFSDVLLALFLTAVWGLVALVSVVNESGWAGGLAVFYWVVALGATAPMLWAWRELSWSFAVPHRRMISVHPLYMLEVGVEKLVAWPLVNFNEPRIVHQFTNGAYTASNVTLQFGKKKVAVSIRGQDLAVEFAQMLQSYRYRALQLLHGGLLEAEDGFDFIPVAHLAPGFRSKVKGSKRKERAKRWGYSAGIAAALAVVAGFVGSLREREKSWANAVNSGSTAEMAKALEQRPDSASSASLDAYRAAQLKEARLALEATLPKTDSRRVALSAVMEALQKTTHPMLTFRQKPGALQGGAGPQATAFTERELHESLGRFPRRFFEGFNEAMTSRAREVLPVNAGSAERGVAVEVALAPVLLEKSVEVGRTRWPRLGLIAKATLNGQALATARVEIDDGDCAMLSAADNATDVVDAQVQRLLWKSGQALARATGLAVEP